MCIWSISLFCTHEHGLNVSQHVKHLPATAALHNAHDILSKGSKISPSSSFISHHFPGRKIQVLEQILVSSACQFVRCFFLNFLYWMDNFNLLTCRALHSLSKSQSNSLNHHCHPWWHHTAWELPKHSQSQWDSPSGNRGGCWVTDGWASYTEWAWEVQELQRRQSWMLWHSSTISRMSGVIKVQNYLLPEFLHLIAFILTYLFLCHNSY